MKNLVVMYSYDVNSPPELWTLQFSSRYLETDVAKNLSESGVFMSDIIICLIASGLNTKIIVSLFSKGYLAIVWPVPGKKIHQRSVNKSFPFT